MFPFVVPPAMKQVEVGSAAGAAALLRARPRRAERLALLREAAAVLTGPPDGGAGTEVGGVPGDEAEVEGLPSAVPPTKLGVP